jgi:hypothetical protein
MKLKISPVFSHDQPVEYIKIIDYDITGYYGTGALLREGLLYLYNKRPIVEATLILTDRKKDLNDNIDEKYMLLEKNKIHNTVCRITNPDEFFGLLISYEMVVEEENTTKSRYHFFMLKGANKYFDFHKVTGKNIFDV